MEATKTTSEALVFDAKALPIVAKYIAQKDPREYLKGIHVRPHPQGGLYIVGTNGHQMAIWHDPHGHCDQERILKVTPGLVAACKKRRRRAIPYDIRVHYENGRLVVAEWNTFDGKADGKMPEAVNELHIQAGIADMDGKYPDMWRVIPKDDEVLPGLHSPINAAYLKKIAETALEASVTVLSNKRWGVAYHYTKGTDGHGCVLTRVDGVPNLLIITMPIRTNPQPDKATPEGFVRPGIFETPAAPAA